VKQGRVCVVDVDKLSNLDDFFEEAEVWLIKLLLPSYCGYTLWGRSLNNGDDILLSSIGKIIISKTTSTLFRFIKSQEGQTTIEAFKSAVEFKQLILSKEFYRLDLHAISYVEHDLVDVRYSVCENFNQPLNLHQCRYMLMCFNMLYDAGITLNNKAIVSKLRRGQSELADLMDVLTFITEDELSSELSRFDFLKICRLYKKLLREFDRNVIVV